MIFKILTYVNNGGSFSTSSISKELGINEFMVDKYKEQLIKQGYIKKKEECSSEACSRCSCGCSSKSLNAIIQWEITEKGINLLNKNN